MTDGKADHQVQISQAQCTTERWRVCKKYIATREGVEKIDQSYRLSPSSQKQQQLIEEIIKDFPDSKEMLEYEDYLKEPTVGNASEFITRALEDNAYEVMQTKTYADYIATRPRAERFGSRSVYR